MKIPAIRGKKGQEENTDNWKLLVAVGITLILIIATIIWYSKQFK